MAIALTTLANPAFAGPIDDALKKVGPAYMCGPNYEYEAALAAVAQEMQKAGVPERLAQYAVERVRHNAEANAADRAKLTAADCATKYGR